MTSRDDEFARKITGYLDQGTAGLKAGTAYRLQSARAQALARLAEPERATAVHLAPALVGAGAPAGSTGFGTGLRAGAKLSIGILLAAAAAYLGYHQWQAYQQLTDLEETDAAILSSDLPIDAYLDRGFQNWLKSTATDTDN